MVAIIAVALLLLVPVVAAAQDVDIQCRIISSVDPVEITAQAKGTPTSAVYWHCNVPMPYVVPATHWFCLTHVNAYIKPGSYLSFNHDQVNHEYHGFTFPPNAVAVPPMAFPPGEPTILVLRNLSGGRVYVKVRAAGFLGQPAGTARELACR